MSASSQMESQQLVSQALTPADTVRIEQLWPAYFGNGALMDPNRPQIISTLFNFFCDDAQSKEFFDAVIIPYHYGLCAFTRSVLLLIVTTCHRLKLSDMVACPLISTS
jgi:hypothetical protein